MEIRGALALGNKQLASLEEGRLIARLLLQAVLDVAETHIIAFAEERLSDQQLTHYRAWLARAEQGEPLPYITGIAPFYDADYLVSPAVLIPRPETEGLVELALTWARESRPVHIFDIGTGSGCIPITLARHAPTGNLYAVDISQAALTIARQNVQRLSPERPVSLVNGDLLGPFGIGWGQDGPWLVTANLPYISDLEWTELGVGVKSYEPALALKGGADGFELIDRLLAQVAAVAEHTNYPGALFLEIGWQQGPAGLARIKASLPHVTVHLSQDFAGLDRYLSLYF